MSENVELQQLMAWLETTVDKWNSAIGSQDFTLASSIAADGLHALTPNEDVILNNMLLSNRIESRVLLHALHDISDVEQVVNAQGWIDAPKAVEFVWIAAHDALERICGCKLGTDEIFSAKLATRMKQILRSIVQRYGVGLYVSPELVYSRMNCTNCGNDIRGCSHSPGLWYNGHICKVDRVPCHIASVAIVENPVDPRCRVWPWHYSPANGESNATFRVAILRVFSLDGDGVNVGKPIDLADLLAPESVMLKEPSQSNSQEMVPDENARASS